MTTSRMIEQPCKWCHGTGRGEHSNSRCEDCNGSGKMRICSECVEQENECNCEEETTTDHE